MPDDKKNIPNISTLDEPPSRERWSLSKDDPRGQDQPAPAKAEALKGKDAPAPSKGSVPQLGKDEKQTTIPGIGDPAPAVKVVDLTIAREGAPKGKPSEKPRPRICSNSTA